VISAALIQLLEKLHFGLIFRHMARRISVKPKAVIQAEKKKNFKKGVSFLIILVDLFHRHFRNENQQSKLSGTCPTLSEKHNHYK